MTGVHGEISTIVLGCMGRLLVLILLFAGGSFRSGIYGVLSALLSFPQQAILLPTECETLFYQRKVASKAAAKGYLCEDWGLRSVGGELAG